MAGSSCKCALFTQRKPGDASPKNVRRSHCHIAGAFLAAVLVAGCTRSAAPEKPPEDLESGDALLRACTDVADHIALATTVAVATDVTESAQSENCVLSGDAPAFETAENPLGKLRTHLGETGFKEEMRYAADGPGTMAFGFTRDGITCVISGGVPSSLEDGVIVSDSIFSIRAICTPRTSSTVEPY